MQNDDYSGARCAAALRQAVSELSRRLRSGSGSSGLSAGKLSVLGRLYRHGSLTPTQLAEMEGVKLQSLTRLVAELEAEGWIERRTDEADARRSRLEMTSSGTKRLRAYVREREAALARAIETRLGPDDRALLAQACTLMERLAAALGDADSELTA